jgi:hypothetical protein
MTTFTVEWTIEIDAASPEEAARKALATMRATVDSVSHVHSFDIYNDDPDEGDGYHHHTVNVDSRDDLAWREPNDRTQPGSEAHAFSGME